MAVMGGREYRTKWDHDLDRKGVTDGDILRVCERISKSKEKKEGEKLQKTGRGRSTEQRKESKKRRNDEIEMGMKSKGWRIKRSRHGERRS